MDLNTVLSISDRLFLFLHIAAGFGALLCFWVPVFARKGGMNHRRVGKIYVNMMWIVLLTAISLSLINLIQGDLIASAFLGYLALITARPLWKGIQVLRSKKQWSDQRRRVDMVLTILVIVFGACLIALAMNVGLEGMGSVLLIFGGLGVLSITDLVQLMKTQKVDWMREHIAGLCVSGIAAHTAFLVFGAQSFVSSIFSNGWAIIPWFLPTLVGLIGIRWANKVYAPQRKSA